MSNFQDAKTWFKMALSDIKRIISNFKEPDYAACIYRIQFCCEKILKGLILLYGAQFKKIHTPSIIIKTEILATQSKLSKAEKYQLTEIIDDASILEDLSTIPRYGLEENGQFIEPEAIYDKNSVLSILPQLINIIKNLIEILKTKKISMWKQFIEDFENGYKGLQDLVA